MDVPQQRTVRCEQQEGLGKAPGDVWLDHQGRRFEFQCKHSLNWTIELPINDALDRIYDATRKDEPGYLYHLKPNIAGDRKEWLEFADWVIASYRHWDLGGTHRFPSEGRQIAEISLMQERKFPGLISGLQSSPGGVHVLSVDLLKKKLRASLGEAYRSISAPASATQVNCLVVDYDYWMIEKSDIAQALYGHISWILSDGELKPNPVWDGIFYTSPTEFFSAVMFVRATEYSPYTAVATVFPNPRWMSECMDAFLDFPRTKVVSSTGDVDL